MCRTQREEAFVLQNKLDASSSPSSFVVVLNSIYTLLYNYIDIICTNQQILTCLYVFLNSSVTAAQ